MVGSPGFEEEETIARGGLCSGLPWPNVKFKDLARERERETGRPAGRREEIIESRGQERGARGGEMTRARARDRDGTLPRTARHPSTRSAARQRGRGIDMCGLEGRKYTTAPCKNRSKRLFFFDDSEHAERASGSSDDQRAGFL